MTLAKILEILQSSKTQKKNQVSCNKTEMNKKSYRDCSPLDYIITDLKYEYP